MRHQVIISFLLAVLSPISSLSQNKPFPTTEDSAKVAQAMSFLQAQEHIPKGPQAVQSPNAASLGSYGEIPVSLYTGKPEINIKLHQLSDGEVTIPISISYDAAGIRPDQHPGWVGLNFNLSTNYSVTRTVRDAPDDNKPNASTLGEHGYAFNTALLNIHRSHRQPLPEINGTISITTNMLSISRDLSLLTILAPNTFLAAVIMALWNTVWISLIRVNPIGSVMHGI